MLKRIAVVLLAATAVTVLAACSGSSPTPSSKGETATSASATPTPTRQPIPDLTGDWVQGNSKSADSYQAATVTAATIEVNWISDSGATSSLYWAGSFTAPTAAGSYSWTSLSDTSKTAGAMLASSDPTKDFTYADGVVSYKVSALGTTTTVELKRK
jgi:hypothetical protein